MKVAIIGGGAAGFFAAIHVKENYPSADVVILEKSKKILSKVKISGGGRCNVTTGVETIRELIDAYPRGGKKLKKSFHIFDNKDAFKWFESKGVPLMVQEDACVFPKSQDSQSIIDCFLDQCQKLNIEIRFGYGLSSMKSIENKIEISYINKDQEFEIFDKIIIATGGSPKRIGLEYLEKLGHKIEEPVPSLFTFNMPDESIKNLMGIVVEKALVNIQGTKLKSDGPLLITHWGMSGPAILKLSAFGARILSEKDYNFNIQVNWVNTINNEGIKAELERLIEEHSNKLLVNIRPYFIPERLWHFLLTKCDLPQDKKWNELGKKGVNKLINVLSNDVYKVKGKTTFKEEFVTCGGISLDSIDMNTMESKAIKNVYFAGELMDIDGITGGFNFQAAWTTAFIAAKLN